MMASPAQHRGNTFWAMAVFILVPLAVQAPIWSGRVDFFSGPASDLVVYVQGIKAFQSQTIRQFGELPLWNPHLLLGQPVVGNIQYALFYPLNLLFWIFPFFSAVWISQALHMALAGWGAWLLARETGCGSAAGVAAGGLYMLNGRMLYYIHAGWIGYLHAICWLPLVLWAVLRVVDRPGLGHGTLLGGLLALCLLCGTPQYAFMGYCLFALHGSVQLINPATTGRRRALAGRLAWTGLVFFTLAAVQLFPSAEQAFLSSRPLSASQPLGFHFALDLQQWVRILVRPEFLSHDHAWELCGYIGVGGLVLALVGMGSRLRQWPLLLVWAGLPVLLSMGPAVPVLDRMVRTVPGLSMLVSPSRYFIFTVLILAVAAGWGFQAIIGRSKTTGHRRAMAAAVLLLLSLSTATLVPAAGPGPPDINLRLLGAAALSGLFMGGHFWRPNRITRWLLVGWLLVDPLLLAPRLLQGYHKADLAPPPRIMAALANFPRPVRVAVIQPPRLYGNLVSVVEDPVFVAMGIDRIGGYEPTGMLRTLRFLTRMDGTPLPDRTFWGIRLFGFARPGLFRLAGVTHLITTDRLDHPRLRLKAEDTLNTPDFHGGQWQHQPVYLYQVRDALPLAYFIARGKGRPESVVTLSRLSPNRRRLSCRAPDSGVVVLSETFHTGWQARVDGRRATVRPFLETFMAVDIPAGTHRIDLDFWPASHVTGYRITLTGGFFLIVLAGYGRLRSWRAKGGRPQDESAAPG